MSCIVTGTVDSADAVEQLADLGDREAVKVIVLP